MQPVSQEHELFWEDIVDRVFTVLTDAGVVCDKRWPGVFRFAPSPLYCTFVDVWRFAREFQAAMLACCTT